MDTRLTLIKHWLVEELKLTLIDIAPASADASFRRYFRARCKSGTFVVMDAPPEQESITEFVKVDSALAKLGVHVPKIHASDETRGLILLEDLGTSTYLEKLKFDSEALYRDALSSLLKIQGGQATAANSYTPVDYSADKLHSEMELFHEWFLQRHFGCELQVADLRLWQDTKKSLVDACLAQPQVWVHRDFHSRNLMITKDNSPGVIDFQDLVNGPIGYDLASLFKDCYIEWPRHQQLEWLAGFHRLSHAEYSLQELVRWYDICGIQRHLKVLGIFCRLHYRDNKPNYMNDLPLVAKYLLEALTLYPEFAEFEAKFAQYVKQAL